MTRTMRLGALAVIVALLGAGCVRESDENANEGTNPSGGAFAVEVQVTDDTIELPDAIPYGPVEFEVTNSGTVEHGFAIEGIDDQLDSLYVDELDVLRVTLDPGTYTVYSPVDGDADSGLSVELTVTDSAPDDNRDPADAGVGPSEEQEPIDDSAP